ncbi:MAG: glycosyltransferase family 2 protein [Candidatus Glassbacteria bacterium]|nr:glycosyltransferase family 2 protein [Candidatus Glassbacteria bacterium]
MGNTSERPDVSVLVPAYNEVENIPELVQGLTSMFDRHGLDGEIVLVDDGSTDGTYGAAAGIAGTEKRLKLLRHRRNFGKTEAMLTGNQAASAEIVVLYDADMQISPEDIPRFLEKMREGQGSDIVCGRKVGRYGKRVVSGIYNFLSRLLFQVPVRDLNTVKAYRRGILEEIHLRHDWHRFFVALAYNRGYRVSELEVELLPRRHGKSKYTGLWRVVVGLLDLISVKFLISLGKKPMSLFGSGGLALLLLGFATGVVALYYRFGVDPPQGYRPLLYLVILFVLAGVLLFTLGFLTELIGQLLERLKNLEDRLRKRDD